MDQREARTCRLPPATSEADDLQAALRAWADAIMRRDALVERVAHARAQLEEVYREHEAAKLACVRAQARVEKLHTPEGG